MDCRPISPPLEAGGRRRSIMGRWLVGRLPGDIVVKRGALRFYFPVVTSLVVSVLVSLILWLLNR